MIAFNSELSVTHFCLEVPFDKVSAIHKYFPGVHSTFAIFTLFSEL